MDSRLLVVLLWSDAARPVKFTLDAVPGIFRGGKQSSICEVASQESFRLHFPWQLAWFPAEDCGSFRFLFRIAMADVFLLQFALYLWSNVVFGQSREDVVYTIDVVFVLESSQTSSKLIDRDRSQKLVWGR